MCFSSYLQKSPTYFSKAKLVGLSNLSLIESLIFQSAVSSSYPSV